MVRWLLVSAALFASTVVAQATVIVSGQAALHGEAGPGGLSGTFYKAGAGTTNFAIANTLSVIASGAVTGTFRATTLSYGGSDGSAITSFLGSDGSSYRGPSGAYDMSDGVLNMAGYLYVAQAGTYNFALSHDDSAQLSIGGQTIISMNCCGTDTNSVSFGSSGYYAIDVVYSNTYYNGGVGGANFSLAENGAVLNASSLTTSVPEPATLMLLGVGVAGTSLVRRRRTGRPVLQKAGA